MLESLRHFLLVAEHGTITGAARRAHVSQPALTSSIHRLEDDLGARLFDRGRHGATLTEAGHALLPHARAAVVAVTEGRRAVDALGRLDAGEVRIGGGQTVCTYLLPPVLSVFRRKHPKVALRLREMPEDRALDAFEAGELDLVIATGDEGEPFRAEQVVLVVAPKLDPRTLPFVSFAPGSAVRELQDRHFPGVEIAMELGSISTVKGSVRAGLGITILPRGYATPADRDLIAIPLTRPTPRREVMLVERGPNQLATPRAVVAFAGILSGVS